MQCFNNDQAYIASPLRLNSMDFTHKWKVSLNFGAQLLFLDLVVNLRFLSLRCGPIIVTSTKGRNIPDVCHLRSFAATTEYEREVTGLWRFHFLIEILAFTLLDTSYRQKCSLYRIILFTRLLSVNNF